MLCQNRPRCAPCRDVAQGNDKQHVPRAVAHEAQRHASGNPGEGARERTCRKSGTRVHAAGRYALHGSEYVGIGCRNLAGQIVADAPREAGERDQRYTPAQITEFALPRQKQRAHVALEARARPQAADREDFWEVFTLTSFRDRNLLAVSQAGPVNNLSDGMSWGVFPLVFMTFGLGVEKIGILKAVYPARHRWFGGLLRRGVPRRPASLISLKRG